jgi:iron(III) transport system ATP-binding protein
VSELQIAGLHKSFGATPVLEDLELTVPAASLVAILGQSGSGKTTLLRVLAGLLRPDRGTITIGQRTVDGPNSHVPTERRRIGYVPQEGALFPHLTVAANVAFGVPRAQRKTEVRRLLELVGLTELAGRYPHQLSGGQQQRVALARALAVKPDIVLLDEPFASLDAHLRASVRDDVHAVLQETRTTTVLVTHDQDEALSTADRIAVLRNGRIAQHGTPQDLYRQPIDEALARFVGEANLIHGVMQGERVLTSLGTLPAAWRDGQPASAARPVNVLVRPEQIDLRRCSDGQMHEAPNGATPLTGRIVRAGYHGHDSLLHVQIDDPEHAGQPLIVRTLGHARLPVGAQVTLTVQDTVLVWPN